MWETIRSIEANNAKATDLSRAEKKRNAPFQSEITLLYTLDSIEDTSQNRYLKNKTNDERERTEKKTTSRAEALNESRRAHELIAEWRRNIADWVRRGPVGSGQEAGCQKGRRSTSTTSAATMSVSDHTATVESASPRNCTDQSQKSSSKQMSQ